MGTRNFPLMYGSPPKLIYQKVPTYEPDDSPPQDLAEKYRAALAEIAAGKIASDLNHPLGESASMAGRFIEIAKNALRCLTPFPSPSGGEDEDERS